MKKSINIKRLLGAFLILSFTLSGCGSSSGSDSPVRLEIIKPVSDSSYGVGQTLVYELEVTNFTLRAPSDRSLMNFRDHPSMDVVSNDHMHDSNDTNPAAREGHYHVYLDDASGTDPHLTAWTLIGEYRLPDDIQSGTHSLRFELRDNNHMPLGTVGSEAVVFFQVP